jgi:hypothetical protein
MPPCIKLLVDCNYLNTPTAATALQGNLLVEELLNTPFLKYCAFNYHNYVVCTCHNY